MFTENAPRCLLRVLGEEGKVTPDTPDDPPPHPYLAEADGSTWDLFVEECLVLSGLPRLADGLILWGAAHYVLHQKVATQRNTMWFLCKYVLLTEPEKAPSAEVMRDIRSLE